MISAEDSSIMDTGKVYNTLTREKPLSAIIHKPWGSLIYSCVEKTIQRVEKLLAELTRESMSFKTQKSDIEVKISKNGEGKSTIHKARNEERLWTMRSCDSRFTGVPK